LGFATGEAVPSYRRPIVLALIVLGLIAAGSTIVTDSIVFPVTVGTVASGQVGFARVRESGGSITSPKTG
jgi:hypothetical protein